MPEASTIGGKDLSISVLEEPSGQNSTPESWRANWSVREESDIRNGEEISRENR